MLTSTLRLLTAALTLMSAGTATELPRTADDQRPQPALRIRHRPAHELTDVCRVDPIVAAPTPIALVASTTALPAPTAAASCGGTPRANSETPQ